MAAAAAAAAAAAGGRPAGATVGLVGGAAPCATADRAHKPARSDPAAAPRGSDRHIGVHRAPALARECQALEKPAGWTGGNPVQGFVPAQGLNKRFLITIPSRCTVPVASGNARQITRRY